MTEDAGRRGQDSPARRPGPVISVVLAVFLLLGGGTALAVGILGQDADPPAPSAAADTTIPGAIPAPSATHQTPDPGPTPATPVALPVSVNIPSIDVQSELITVGLNPDGTLEVPQPGPDYDKAAWFRDSPRPGETGPAVIEGHVDSAANGPSVFYDLGRMTAGDRVEVGRADGSVATFEVYDIRVVPKDDFPTLLVYGNTTGPELRLITCGGPFDSSAGSYVDNVIVFARQV
ncbi:class F sortase [Blastococcus mobilis]|uniref:LPXTG-site transpeptidase (Sortase) family protein n=1 Tax=Blastococcus mobilis TaxID=1938746 RepID=A0A239AXA5_9ACTN|nr:class F sortase [Blastococcus mobilis]SNS00129.1 LPXTG-site transpeptidase (sortase) family protein [Blastococcus mobilis]